MHRRWKKSENDQPAVVGARLTQALSEARLSREELASLIGEQLDTIAAYEEGAPIPREPLKLIAKATEKPLDWFLRNEESGQRDPVASLRWWLDASRQDVVPYAQTPDPSSGLQNAAEPAAQTHETALWVETTVEVEPTVTAPASARTTPTKAELAARADELEQREQKLAEAETDLAERTRAAAEDQTDEYRRLAEAEAALSERRREVESAAEQLTAQEQELRAEREELERATTALKDSDASRSELDAELARRSAELEQREQHLAEAEARLRERDETVAAGIAEERRRLGDEEARIKAATAAVIADKEELQAVVEEELRARRRQLEEEFLQQSLHQAADLSRRKLELVQLEHELALLQRRLDERDLAAPKGGAA